MTANNIVVMRELGSMPPILKQSQTPRDAQTGAGLCGSNKIMGGYQARCGYGTRLPMLLVSAWARQNYVDHGVTDQTSITRFIEDNWQTGRIGNYSFDAMAGDISPMFEFSKKSLNPRLFLGPTTGEVVHSQD